MGFQYSSQTQNIKSLLLSFPSISPHSNIERTETSQDISQLILKGLELEAAVLTDKDLGPRLSRDFQYLLTEYLTSTKKRDPNDVITLQRQLLNYKLRFEDYDLNEIETSVNRIHSYMNEFISTKKLSEDVTIRTSASLLFAINKLTSESFFLGNNKTLQNLVSWLEPFDKLNTLILHANILSNQEKYELANYQYYRVINLLESNGEQEIHILDTKLKIAINYCCEFINSNNENSFDLAEEQLFEIINTNAKGDDYATFQLDAKYILSKLYLTINKTNLAIDLLTDPKFQDPNYKYHKDIKIILENLLQFE
jgi:hypothetical protein